MNSFGICSPATSPAEHNHMSEPRTSQWRNVQQIHRATEVKYLSKSRHRTSPDSREGEIASTFCYMESQIFCSYLKFITVLVSFIYCVATSYPKIWFKTTFSYSPFCNLNSLDLGGCIVCSWKFKTISPMCVASYRESWNIWGLTTSVST